MRASFNDQALEIMLSKTRLSIALLALILASQTQASPRQMGLDYRQMLSNYTMLKAVDDQCPDRELPKLINRYDVEMQMQEKIGFDNFIKLMEQINQSDLRENALATIDKLFETLDGCEDPRLQGSLDRLQQVHEQAYERFAAEPALTKPREVPIPMRRPEG